VLSIDRVQNAPHYPAPAQTFDDLPFANENGWRARKIRAEFERLGILIGLATVSRYLPKRDPDHDQHQRWRTFLRNPRHGIAAMDFLVVPTLRFRLLYAWFVIGHERREIMHFGVRANPTWSWVVQQHRVAFPEETAPRFLIYDNGSIFSDRVTEPIEPIGIEPRHRRPQSLDCLESAAFSIATSGGKQLDRCDSSAGETGPSPSG
jgi:hypothetical protein